MPEGKADSGSSTSVSTLLSSDPRFKLAMLFSDSYCLCFLIFYTKILYALKRMSSHIATCVAVWSRMVALGHLSGRVSFVRFMEDLKLT